MEDNNKVTESLKSLESSINYLQHKIKQSKLVALFSFILASIFIIIFIILLSLNLTIIHQSILLTFAIVSLVLGFVFIQVGIVNVLLIKYLYKVKLNNLTNVINVFKKDINK